jgi:hypothetical protein
MLWERIRVHWDELVAEACDRWHELTCEDVRATDGDLTLFLAVVRERTGLTEEDAAVAIESWAEDLSEIDVEPLDEATRHAGRDDVHEQREHDQTCEGMLRWPPHVGTLHVRGTMLR